MHEVATKDILIVGAGMAGLYSAYRFLSDGFNVRVVEAGAGVGGTWYWNRYPGARCDIPSVDYSFSFSPELQNEWTWSERYATQPEIERYLNHVADRFGLREHIDFNTRVTQARFNESVDEWTILTDKGRYLCRFLIMATGPLTAPNLPNFPGLENFKGPVYHSARWPRVAVNFTGQSVGIIGTGSTGIQLIPQIAKQADQLIVFQRTPNYSVPAQNRPLSSEYMEEIRATYPERRSSYRQSKGGVPPIAPPISKHSAMEVSPSQRDEVYEYMWEQGAGLAFRSAFSDVMTNAAANETAAEFIRRKIRQTVQDPATADKLTPKDYPYATKRPPVDINYYDTFNRRNVTLVDIRTHPIQLITEAGLQTDVNEYNFETLVLATGFDAATGALSKINVEGPGGVTVAEKWEQEPRCYLGMAIAEFPNLFLVNGPGGPGTFTNNAALTEQNVEWLHGLIMQARSRGETRLQVSKGAETAWIEHLQEVVEGTLYLRADSWYLGANIPGKPRIFMFYSGGFDRYCRICERVAREGYVEFFDGRVARAAGAHTP